ncbi:hypothetical protein [Methylobacterium sp. Leaf112]|uniref:hypothetical protein n=1 Tax=Methylobacterium sp. Leaf112 TaxID=1736258 RepID=UPI0006FF16DB|nr:hypothetical protein [Methylobacterium sp. Leaf112]KQP72086.1 hypothetical protein ASF52_00680 [Methylobacterium sp. Leaf112]
MPGIAARRTQRLVLAAALLAAPAAFGQGADNPDSVKPQVSVAAGKPVQIAVLNPLKRDCSLGAAPTLRVPGLPKHGRVIATTASIATGKKNRCPDQKVSGQVVVYQANAQFTGFDEVQIEVETTEGEVRRATIRIEVTQAGLPAGQQRL